NGTAWPSHKSFKERWAMCISGLFILPISCRAGAAATTAGQPRTESALAANRVVPSAARLSARPHPRRGAPEVSGTARPHAPAGGQEPGTAECLAAFWQRFRDHRPIQYAVDVDWAGADQY